MGWEQRADPPAHVCDLPGGDSTSIFGALQVHVGSEGDRYRCDDCGQLWRIGLACDWCDRYRKNVPHGGQHAVGVMWREAREGWWAKRRRKRREKVKA